MTQQPRAFQPRMGEGEQVDRRDWEGFLNDFSERNQETACRVELLGGEETGRQVLVEGRPLLDVTLDDAAGPAQIVVECGAPGGVGTDAFRHILQDPTVLRAHVAEDASWEAIEIESRGGDAVIVTVHPRGA